MLEIVMSVASHAPVPGRWAQVGVSELQVAYVRTTFFMNCHEISFV
jgi:hypothetical protein